MNIIEVLTMAVKLKDQFIEEAFANANIFGYLFRLIEGYTWNNTIRVRTEEIINLALEADSKILKKSVILFLI
jgi:hypothetical protein